LRVYLSDNRTELSRTDEYADAGNSCRFRGRQPSLRGLVVLRDEEAVGGEERSDGTRHPDHLAQYFWAFLFYFPVGNAR
jgi:hypothetical protein